MTVPHPAGSRPAGRLRRLLDDHPAVFFGAEAVALIVVLGIAVAAGAHWSELIPAGVVLLIGIGWQAFVQLRRSHGAHLPRER